MKYATVGQRFVICVRDTNGLVTGDAANLTCQLSIDGGTRVDLTTNTATPIYESDGVTETGYYSFPASTAEVTGHELSITPASSVSGNECFGVPGNVIYTDISHLIKEATDLIPTLIALRTSRQANQTLYLNTGETISLPILTNKDYTATDIEVVISSLSGIEIAVITPTPITALQVTIDVPATVTLRAQTLLWAIRETANGDKSNDHGKLIIDRIATNYDSTSS